MGAVKAEKPREFLKKKKSLVDTKDSLDCMTAQRMEFNLKKVLKTLLISTSEPVSIKDIQAVIGRYHEQREKETEQASTGENETDGENLPSLPDTPVASVASSAPPSPQPETFTDVPHLARHDNASQEVTQRVIQDIIDQVPTLLTATQIREAAESLNQEMEDSGEVTRILQGPEGFRLTVAPEYSEWVRLLRNDPKPMRLSQAALETLAVVAYRQPATRSEIESIRGVSADNALSRLIDLELVHVTGRADLPGRPIQYGTTEKFLDFCGLKSLADLPASDVLSPGQISEWIARATNPAKLTANDVGLAEDDGTERRGGERTTLLDSGAPDPVPAAISANAFAPDVPDASDAPVAPEVPPAPAPPPPPIP
jgi:segregation and condensation protein B